MELPSPPTPLPRTGRGESSLPCCFLGRFGEELVEPLRGVAELGGVDPVADGIVVGLDVGTGIAEGGAAGLAVGEGHGGVLSAVTPEEASPGDGFRCGPDGRMRREEAAEDEDAIDLAGIAERVGETRRRALRKAAEDEWAGTDRELARQIAQELRERFLSGFE